MPINDLLFWFAAALITCGLAVVALSCRAEPDTKPFVSDLPDLWLDDPGDYH